MAQKRELWFRPGMMKRHSGFSKDFSVERNFETMYKNAKLKNPEDRLRRVIKQATVLANLSQDKVTKTKAREVSNKASKKLARLKER